MIAYFVVVSSLLKSQQDGKPRQLTSVLHDFRCQKCELCIDGVTQTASESTIIVWWSIQYRASQWMKAKFLLKEPMFCRADLSYKTDRLLLCI